MKIKVWSGNSKILYCPPHNAIKESCVYFLHLRNGYSRIETTQDGSGINFHTGDLADCIAKSPFKETLIPKVPHQRWAIPEHLNRRAASVFTTFALRGRNREDLHILKGQDI
jgi:hypothetical protein